MSNVDYLIGGVLVLLVLRQIPERRQTLRSLILPVVLVAAAAAYYLRSFPTGGHDLLLYLVLGLVGVAFGVGCGATTHMQPDGQGQVLVRAGWLAAALWVIGMAGRMAFAYAAEHGFGPAVVHFSLANQITGEGAWTAALVLMALAEVAVRLAVLRIRGRRIRIAHPASPQVGVPG